MKKILVLSYDYPPLGGGASPVVNELVKGYQKLGNFVSVITMGYKGLPRQEIIDGINIYRMKCLRSKKELCHPWEQFTYIISAKKFLKNHLKTNKYDICHTHFLIPTGILSYWVKKNYKIPYIITAHGSDVPGFNPDRFKFLHKFTKPTLKKICYNAKKVVSPSKYLLNLINKNIISLPNNSIVIPNGIYPQDYSPLKKKKIILSTGRLLKRKGFQYLIKAVSEEDFGYEVHICGDGPMRNELEDLAKKSKTKIIFHGWINNQSKEYKELLGSASIYCLVSGKENSSVSLLEAMSSGCAVITSNISGCPETIGDTGICISPGNYEILREKLDFLIKNQKVVLNYGKLAREKVLKNYDWKLLIKKYIEILI
jgi:glycosyltransferase involved in cell wall biosynthesis